MPNIMSYIIIIQVYNMNSSKLGDSDLINLLRNLINGLNITTAHYEVRIIGYMILVLVIYVRNS